MALISETAFKQAVADLTAALTDAMADDSASGMATELRSPSHPLRRIKELFKFDPETGVVTTDTDYIDAVYLGKNPSKGNPFDVVAN